MIKQIVKLMQIEAKQQINEWYKQVLLKNVKEIISSAETYAILVIVFLLWNFILGRKFEWQQYSPLSQPDFFVRSFYSAFVYYTLGRFLYAIRYYKVLHDILVKGFRLWGLFNLIKGLTWIILMYISYSYIVPWIFDVLNTSASILFNVAGIVLYAIPPVGIALILSIIYLFFKKKIKYEHQ